MFFIAPHKKIKIGKKFIYIIMIKVDFLETINIPDDNFGDSIQLLWPLDIQD